MEARFDVFKSDSNGDWRWVQAVPDFATAKVQVHLLGEKWPGKYLILDQQTGEKITAEVGSPGVEAPRTIC